MHEDVIIKRGYAPGTPLHHDRPYFIVKGKLNLSIWLSTSNISKKESLICYKKSHLTDNLYLPKLFISDTDASEPSRKHSERFIPLKRELLNQNDATNFELDTGDAIIFLNKTVHEAPAHNRDITRKSIVIRYFRWIQTN
jgi:ectoine hydroxylase-related dioxygenase (phytanoyl-CoA dioxygenase family)